MNTELAIITPSQGVTVAQAIAAMLAAPNPNTRRAYSASLDVFAQYVGAADGVTAAIELLSLPHGQANLIAMQYREWLIGKNISAKTINLRLAALRSASKLARKLGCIPWALEVSDVPVKDYRDTSGPGIDAVKEMVKATASEEADPARAARDVAIIALCCDLGLRRQSVTTLDYEHLDFDRHQLNVQLKGRHDRELFFAPSPTWRKLLNWLEHRGSASGPLFFALDRAASHRASMQRMSGEAIRLVVKRAGDRVGVRARPHGLRHSAATHVAQETGNVFAVQGFLRHESASTSQHYIDNVNDLGRRAAELVAGETA